MNLFVDIDDTLVLYQTPGTNPYGYYLGEPFIINEALLRGIKEFAIETPDSMIILWSGGGKQYAKMWADQLEISKMIIPMLKDKDTFILIKPGDIVVDDTPLGGLRTHTPYEWPEGE